MLLLCICNTVCTIIYFLCFFWNFEFIMFLWWNLTIASGINIHGASDGNSFQKIVGMIFPGFTIPAAKLILTDQIAPHFRWQATDDPFVSSRGMQFPRSLPRSQSPPLILSFVSLFFISCRSDGKWAEVITGYPEGQAPTPQGNQGGYWVEVLLSPIATNRKPLVIEECGCVMPRGWLFHRFVY